jgi:opacity protein-like surface antigen
MRLSCLLLALLPVAAQAQAPASNRPVQLVVTGGFQLPTGDFGDVHDAGLQATVSVLVRAAGLRFRPELAYSRFDVKETLQGVLGQRLASGGLGGRRDATTELLSTMLSGFANFELPLGQGRVQPFVLAGVGAVRLATDATSAAIDLRETKASINLGAGVRLRLGAISGLIEARLNNIPGADASAFFKDVRTIPVTFGLVF